MSPGGDRPALDGIRVLDFTHVLAGPFCTMILADLGAEVLKVEHPAGGDLGRRAGGDQFGTYFGSLNRGKLGAVLDLKQPEGLELAVRLAEKADVLVQNYGPGSFEAMGLGYEALSRRNPGLIYASVTGFGHDGPWADRPGVDPLIQAISGLMSITGEPDGPPVRVGYSATDIAGGVWLAIGVLAALNERNRSGKGQFLDVSLLEAQMSFLENAIARSLNGGEAPARLGSRRHEFHVTQSYETSDGWFITEFEDRNWQAACGVLGHPEWPEDPKLASPERNPAANEAIRAVLLKDTTANWMSRLSAVGLACRPIKTVAEGIELPPIQERGFINETVDASGRLLRIVGSPLRLSRTPGRVRGPAPLLGEHTRHALQTWIGLSEEEIDAYADKGIFTIIPVETRRPRRELYF
jgi:crotonobetainyl-CoA:carnitine CoA-transferase CaiB-like acyl-CoA transferase